MAVKSTLSTANNSESDVKFSTYNFTGTVVQVAVKNFVEGVISIAAKATYYLNYASQTTGATTVYIRGDLSNTIIRAVCAYL